VYLAVGRAYLNAVDHTEVVALEVEDVHGGALQYTVAAGGRSERKERRRQRAVRRRRHSLSPKAGRESK
jgi:hypothetical protein